MLDKLSALWKSRAAVNNDHPDYTDLHFDPFKKDFSESLLPFRDHILWCETDFCLSDAEKAKGIRLACCTYLHGHSVTLEII